MAFKSESNELIQMRISSRINLPQQRCRSWLRELGIRSHAELFANVLDGTGIVVDNFAVFVHSLQKRRYKGGQKNFPRWSNARFALMKK